MLRGLLPSLLAVALSALSLPLASPVAAAEDPCTISWRAPVSGSWSSPASWAESGSGLARLPHFGDVTCIQVAGTYDVLLDRAASVREFRLGASDGSGQQRLRLVPGAEAPSGAVLGTYGAMTVGSSGALVLDDTGRPGSLRVESEGPFTSAGDITVRAPRGYPEIIARQGVVVTGNVHVSGALRLPWGTWAGSFTVAADGDVDISGPTRFLGPVVNDGSLDAFDAVLGVHARLTGQPVSVARSELDPTGASGLVQVRDRVVLTGDVGSDLTLDLMPDPHAFPSLKLDGTRTNDGTIRLSSSRTDVDGDKGEDAHVQVPEGAALLNRGRLLVTNATGTKQARLAVNGVLRNDGVVEARRDAMLELDELASVDEEHNLRGGRWLAHGGGLHFGRSVPYGIAAHVSVRDGGRLTALGGTPLLASVYAVEEGGELLLDGAAETVPSLHVRGLVRLSAGSTLTASRDIIISDGRVELDAVSRLAAATRVQRNTDSGRVGTLAGPGTVQGDVLVQSGGRLHPSAGAPAGLLAVDGGLSVRGGEVLVDVNGPAADQVGRVTAAGPSRLQALELRVTTADGYDPEPGLVHRVLAGPTTHEGIQQLAANDRPSGAAPPDYRLRADSSGLGLVVPDGTSDAVVHVDVQDVTVVEGDEGSFLAEVVLVRTGDLDEPFQVDLRAVERSATSLWDYYAQEGPVEFGPGQREERFLLQVRSDTTAEGHEQLDIVLVPSGTTTTRITTSGGTVTILDDDGAIAPRPTDRSCPAGQVPEDGFLDVPEGGTHEPAVDCAVWWQVTRGVSPRAYQPAAVTTRAQMASFLARLVERSGGDLPSPTRDHFDDDDGSPHEDSINALAEAGIVRGRSERVFDPLGSVRRDAMASFLVRTYEHRTARTLREPGDFFDDDDGSVHRTSIDRAADAGFTAGRSERSYEPSATVHRAAMASFLVRVLDLLVADDGVRPPG